MNISALVSITLLAVTLASSQTPPQKPRVIPTEEIKQQLTSDLQILDAQSRRLTSPLARARAKAEVASALWYLDQEAAKEILTDAYQITLPDEEERERSRARAVGADLPFPTELERARREVQSRVLQVAGRDHTYAKQLLKLGTESLGKNEANRINATLARQALNDGDTEAAGKYLADAIEAEPTQTQAGFLIEELAKKDRAAANALIIQYIDRLRSIPFTFSQGTVRTYFILMRLIFPALASRQPGESASQQVQPPGPAVMKAYASYVVQNLWPLKQTDPGGLARLRGIILTAGQPVRQYAPELMPAYLELERLSRSGNEGNSSQTAEDLAESNRRERERQVDAALNQDTLDPSLIEAAVRRGMFEKARDAIKTLPDGDRKTQLKDFVDAQEAISLVAKGDVLRAERLAETLRTAPQILEVYLSLVKKCKDESCKNPLIYKALNQIKTADNLSMIAPANAPMELISTKRESDPKLTSLNRLAMMAVASEDEDLVQATCDEMIRAVNRTSIDSDLGKLGFDIDLFKKIAPKNEDRAQQLAVGITNPLRQIAALSAIYEWKASELKKREGERRGVEKKAQ